MLYGVDSLFNIFYLYTQGLFFVGIFVSSKFHMENFFWHVFEEFNPVYHFPLPCHTKDSEQFCDYILI